jgi:hypothetical protein
MEGKSKLLDFFIREITGADKIVNCGERIPRSLNGW